jgi:hypothetical protein
MTCAQVVAITFCGLAGALPALATLSQTGVAQKTENLKSLSLEQSGTIAGSMRASSGERACGE